MPTTLSCNVEIGACLKGVRELVLDGDFWILAAGPMLLRGSGDGCAERW